MLRTPSWSGSRLRSRELRGLRPCLRSQVSFIPSASRSLRVARVAAFAGTASAAINTAAARRDARTRTRSTLAGADDPFAALADLVVLVRTQPIAALAAVDRVLSPVHRVEDVVAAAAEDHVLALAGVDVVVAGAALERVVAGAAGELVVARVAEQHVVPVGAAQAVVAGAAEEVVVAEAPAQLVLADPAE